LKDDATLGSEDQTLLTELLVAVAASLDEWRKWMQAFNAYPVFVGKMPSLRACSRQPHHALKITAVILRRAAASPALGRQQRPDHSPLVVRQTNPLAQGFLQKEALNQSPSVTSTFVHET